jgi:hypothetical protein
LKTFALKGDAGGLHRRPFPAGSNVSVHNQPRKKAHGSSLPFSWGVS